MKNQEPNGDRFENDPRPEVGSSIYQSHHAVESDPDLAPHRRFQFFVKTFLSVFAEIFFFPEMAAMKAKKCNKSLEFSLKILLSV